MDSDKLLTVQEFNNLVTKWAMRVRARSRATLSSGTHGTGQLATTLGQFVDKKSPTDAAYKVKFQFSRYGAFRAYGAGRGWVVINGTLTKGFRARCEREIRNRTWNEYTRELSKNGYTTAQINRAKYTSHGSVTDGKERKPLDWIDQHINATIDELANDVQEFYGDEALRSLLAEYHKMRIVKK